MPGCSIHKILRIDGDVFALAEDSLWRGAEQVIRREDATLVDRNISALSMDGSARLWIGYFDRGLQILGGERYEDDHLFCVNRIAHDAARGISAVATANGLVMFDAAHARRRVITHDDGLIANQVTDVVLRPDGSAIAATPAGVSFIDASGISSIYAFQGLVNNHVYALASDGARTLAGTLGGLVDSRRRDGEGQLHHRQLRAETQLDHGDGRASTTTGSSAPTARESCASTARAAGRRFDEYARDDRDQRQCDGCDAERGVRGNARSWTGGLQPRGGRWNFFTAGLPSRNVTAIEARGGVVYVGTDNGLVKIPESTLVR